MERKEFYEKSIIAMASQLADEFAKVSQLASQLQQLALQMDENIAFFH